MTKLVELKSETTLRFSEDLTKEQVEKLSSFLKEQSDKDGVLFTGRSAEGNKFIVSVSDYPIKDVIREIEQIING